MDILLKGDDELLALAPDNLIVVPQKKKDKRNKDKPKDSDNIKANVIETKGNILREDGNGYFRVELDEPTGHECLCHASGKLITRRSNCLLVTESLLN